MTEEIKNQESVMKRDLSSLTLAQRIKLKRNSPVLLLDVSGSMATYDDYLGVDLEDEDLGRGQNKSRIAKLRDIVQNLKSTSDIYYFSNDIGQCTKDTIPNPMDNTYLGRALEYLKSKNIKKVVIVTDGEVNDKDKAIEAAKDLHLDIIYVGGPNKPAFLDDLAHSAGGSCSVEDLTLELTGKLDQLLLTAGIEDIKL